jgi:polysaccharide biosynthesis protein PslG
VLPIFHRAAGALGSETESHCRGDAVVVALLVGESKNAHVLPRCGSVAAVALVAIFAGAPAPASLYGVNAHVPPPVLLDEIAASGVRWVRIDVLWSWVEPQPDRFDWAIYDDLVDGALARGLRLYATIADTPAWATDGPAGRGVPRSAADWYDVCYRAASRYRGRIDHWGMWNEPNDDRFWAGSRSEYVTVILKPGAAAVHAASPAARACGPELGHLQSNDWDAWLSEVLRQASADLDVVTHHIYPDGASSRSVMDQLANGSPYPWDPPSVRKVLKDAGWLGRPFWLTETGCSSGATGSGEAAQAAFVANLSQALFGPERAVSWVHRVFFYEIADDPRFASARFGLLGPPPEYAPKPAFDELRRTVAELEADDAEVVRVDVPDWLPPGGTAQGAVLVRNSGTTAWDAADGYMLATVGDTAVTAVVRDGLAAGEIVWPGEEREFVLDLLAPAAASPPGVPIVLEWQMERAGRWRFGEVASCAIAIGDGGVERSWTMPIAGFTDADGATWTTDVVLHNRGSLALDAKLAYLAEGEDNTFARTVSITAAPGSTVVLADVLGQKFGTGGRGVLRITAASAALLPAAMAHVETVLGRATELVRGQGSETAIPGGGEGRALRLARSGDGTALRSDLVLLNPAERATTVEVEVVGDGGVVSGTLVYVLAPFEVRVVDDVLDAAGIAAAGHAQALVRPAPDGPGVHAWALRCPAGGAAEVLPLVGASDEPVVLMPVEGGSRLRGGAWRTDVQLANPGSEPAVVALALLAAAGQAPRVPQVEVEVRGGEDLVIDNALAALFGYRGSGALLITPRSGQVVAAAGTALARSSAPSGRTITPLPTGSAVGDGGECRLFPVSRGVGEAGTRTHLGVANVSGVPIMLRVQVLNAAGSLLRVLSRSVPANEYRQVADVLQGVPTTDGGAAVIKLRADLAGGRFVAFATVVETGGATVHVPCS